MFEENRRRYPRANYPCYLTIWMTDGTNETILANTSNIGVGGLCVSLNHSLQLGILVDIQLHFPGNSTPLKCQGKVLRSIAESERFFNIGIEFKPLSELQHAFVESKVSDLMALEKGKS